MSTESKIYRGVEILDCQVGLYRVHWKTGGSSLASVGFSPTNIRWIAPCDWEAGSMPITQKMKNGCRVIGMIDYMVLLEFPA